VGKFDTIDEAKLDLSFDPVEGVGSTSDQVETLFKKWGHNEIPSHHLTHTTQMMTSSERTECKRRGAETTPYSWVVCVCDDDDDEQ